LLVIKKFAVTVLRKQYKFIFQKIIIHRTRFWLINR